MSRSRALRRGIAVWVVGWLALATPALTAEHGGQEHAGQEHGGATTAAVAAAPAAQPAVAPVQTVPTASQLRARIAAYVKGKSAERGTFDIEDDVTGSIRKLAFIRVHQRVGKTGDYYYSCTDMRDTESGELLDLDFDIEAGDGQLEVVDERIHKVSGTPRYTYDEHDNRIPVP